MADSERGTLLVSQGQWIEKRNHCEGDTLCLARVYEERLAQDGLGSHAWDYMASRHLGSAVTDYVQGHCEKVYRIGTIALTVVVQSPGEGRCEPRQFVRITVTP